MKRVYSSPDSGQVAFIQSMLEAAGIECELRNEAVSQVMMGIPFAPEVWVEDKDVEEAQRLIAESRSE